jgi:hypothetical protein
MTHYAKVVDKVVTEVIVAEEDFFKTFVDNSAGTWLETSINMHGGKYIDYDTRLPVDDQSIINDSEGGKRKNFAGIGFTYDQAKNAFINLKPFDSWVLSETTCRYVAPTAKPDDGKKYNWNEETTAWVEIN